MAASPLPPALTPLRLDPDRAVLLIVDVQT
jgi:isochorismate hydrolase